MSNNLSMTPKEKATELVEKYYLILTHGAVKKFEPFHYQSKQFALLAVDEIITTFKMPMIHFTSCYDPKCPCCEYWQQVKEEINRL